jgi:hypothetical protein
MSGRCQSEFKKNARLSYLRQIDLSGDGNFVRIHRQGLLVSTGIADNAMMFQTGRSLRC